MPDTVLEHEDLLVLWGGAVEPTASPGQGLTRVSIVATPRWVFSVPHQELRLSPGSPWGPVHLEQDVDALRERVAAAVDIAALEADLAQALSPDRRWELARLAAHKVNGHTLAFRERGAFTWDGCAVGVGAFALKRFFERHASEVEQARAALAAEPMDVEHLGRGRAALGTAAALGICAASLGLGVSALVMGGTVWTTGIGFPFGVLGPALLGHQAVTLWLGEQRDRATGRPPGRLTSLRTVAAVIGALLAAPAYPVLMAVLAQVL